MYGFWPLVWGLLPTGYLSSLFRLAFFMTLSCPKIVIIIFVDCFSFTYFFLKKGTDQQMLTCLVHGGG